MSQTPGQSAEAVILTALPVEYAAVVAAVGAGTTHEWNGVIVHRGAVEDQRVLVVPIGGMGNARAALAAQRAIAAWNPSRLLLVGIAGGIPAGADDLRLGDVLVPDQVVSYELAKVKPGATERRWEVFRPDDSLLLAARRVTPAEWIHAIASSRPDGSDARVNPLVHVGPVLSGDKVLADPATVDGLRLSWPQAVGVEMEAFGIALAAYRNGPAFLMVKAVSDFADAAKDDDWHRYAAAAAAHFAVAVLRRSPVSHDPARPQSVPSTAPTTFPGRVKLRIIRQLGADWEDVADLFDIEPYVKARFQRGNEPRELWEWLQIRGKLPNLIDTLDEVGRRDLADHMRTNGT